VGGRDVGGRDVGGRDVGGRDVGGRDVGGRDVGDEMRCGTPYSELGIWMEWGNPLSI